MAKSDRSRLRWGRSWGRRSKDAPPPPDSSVETLDLPSKERLLPRLLVLALFQFDKRAAEVKRDENRFRDWALREDAMVVEEECSKQGREGPTDRLADSTSRPYAAGKHGHK